MTSFTQSDYYFNEIDALSCNTRPISSTLRTKSAYTTHEDDTTGYDLYGNQDYNDGSSCDSYNYQQRSTSTVSNSGNYITYYSNDGKQYCKNVITTDNVMYHRDACSGDSSRERYDIYTTRFDYGDYECLNFETNSRMGGNGRDSNNKMLPQVPTVQHSHSMWDGMYGNGQHRKSNVSLPSTPTIRYNDGSVGVRATLCCNNSDWDRGYIANSVKAQLNGQRHFDQMQNPPSERKLPLAQSHVRSQTFLKKPLKQQFFQDNTDNIATTTTTTTSMSTYRNQINLDYKNAMPISSSTQNIPAQNFYSDNGRINDNQLQSHQTDYNNSLNSLNTYESLYTVEPRANTITNHQLCDDYNDFAFNSVDNNSAYSDTMLYNVTGHVNQQQKIQDMQKCRYSIFMAMTTASVIASGETRIPQHLLKKTTKAMTVGVIATDISTTNVTECTGPGIDSSAAVSLMGIEHNDRNSAAMWYSSGSNNLTTCAYANVTTTKSNQSLTDLISPNTLTTTSTASTPLFLTSLRAPSTVADVSSSESNINQNTMSKSNVNIPSNLSLVKNLTSRKLPKHHSGHSGRGIVTNLPLPPPPTSPQQEYSLEHSSNANKTLPLTPQLSAANKTAQALYNKNMSSYILSATSTTSATSAIFTSSATFTSSTISPKFSLISYQCNALPSNPFQTTANKTDQIGLVAEMTTTTTAAVAEDLKANNNNTNTITNMEIKSGDNFNKYRNYNLFNNNVQNFKGQEENREGGKKHREEEQAFPYHLSETPSKLNNLKALNNTTSPTTHQIETSTSSKSNISLLSSAMATTSEIIETHNTTTVPSLAEDVLTNKTTTSQAYLSMFDDDYKTFTSSYNYSDYLKPYTLPTYLKSDISSNITSHQYNLTQSSGSSTSSYLAYPKLDIHSDYLTYSSSSIAGDISTALAITTTTSLMSSLATNSTSISASISASALTSPKATANAFTTAIETSTAFATATSTDTTFLGINNTGLDNNIAVLNLRDINFGRKNNINSPPLTETASPNANSITSILAAETPTENLSNIQTLKTMTMMMTTVTTATTPMIQTSSSNTLALHLEQETKKSFDLSQTDQHKAKEKSASSSSLYTNNYDNYFKNYKLDIIMEPSLICSTTTIISSTSTTTSSSSPTIQTFETTANSSMLNQSWPTSTTMSSTYKTTTTSDTQKIHDSDNSKSYASNNNENLDLKASNLLNTPDSLFATTKRAKPLTNQDFLTITANTTSTPTLYNDYLKNYDTVTVTASSSTSLVTEVLNNTSEELPAYIRDFLNTSTNANEYDSTEYLNFYKITDETITTTGSKNDEFINKQNYLNDLNVNVSSDQANINEIKQDSKTSSTTCNTNNTMTTLTEQQAIEPITTSTMVATTTTFENQLNTNTALAMVDFDYNFYDSFNVNLNSLIDDKVTCADSTHATTTTKSDITEAVTKSEIVADITKSSTTSATSYSVTSTDPADYSNSYNNRGMDVLHNNQKTGTVVGTTRASEMVSATTYTALSTDSALSTYTAVTSFKSPQLSTPKPTTADIKAANMLGGFSQSLKGGLDGVLASAGSEETQTQRRGFGFGLASKFVPSVGGFLGSVTKSTASISTIQTQPPKTISALESNTNLITASSNIDFYPNVTSSANDIVTTLDNNVIDFVTASYTNGEKENIMGSLYYNSSGQATYYHMTSSLDYAQDEIANHTEQMMLCDDTVTENLNKECYADEMQALDMYGGYSEYDTIQTTGQIMDNSIPVSTLIDTVATSKVTTATTAMPQAPITTTFNNSTTVTAARKATNSLFSSLTNVASQMSQQNTAATVTTVVTTVAVTTKPASGGGMFGSIFGKAAAAMQTATQVVNQGATIASSKVQKNLQTSSAVALNNQVPTTAQPTATTENSYQRNVISHQNSLASPYSSSLAGDDYDHSNMSNNDADYAQNYEEEGIEVEDYYYGNQTQTNQLIHQKSQQKLLPTVPPGGGSTGKKLPTINDKSGCLIKQQPTEIYEEDPNVLDNKSQPCLQRVSTYDIDSEQAHYYMDTQPVAPSAVRHMTTANGYYEHTPGVSYDYRDDYFNEEDEFKYLEKEEIQDKEDMIYTKKEQQNQQLRQIHKQSSLQYIVDDDFQREHNEDTSHVYLDDVYHSEDSGNYLDESSSGSVKALMNNQKIPSITTTKAAATITTTTATTITNLEDDLTHQQTKKPTTVLSTATTAATVTSATHLHQQIKKQDSIILEEDEKDDLSSIAGQHDTVTSPSKSLSRKSSHDILDDEDHQMSDLHLVSSGLRLPHSRKIKLMRGETEEVVGGHMQIMKRKTEVTAKQRWHWAYNKIIMQLNVSRIIFQYLFYLIP